MLKITDWGIIQTPESYKAPEQWPIRLSGVVTGHDRMKDGEQVVTSTLVALNIPRKSAKTRSGSCYKLGKPSAAFMAFLKDSGKSLKDYRVLKEKKDGKKLRV